MLAPTFFRRYTRDGQHWHADPGRDVTSLDELHMITADLLTRIPLFAGIPAPERASLAARAADVRIQKDEWLLVEGQSAAFFGLLEGRLAVIKAIGGRDHHVATFEPGERPNPRAAGIVR